MNLVSPKSLLATVFALLLVAASCADPDLGPPSALPDMEPTPTPTPTPEPDDGLGPTNEEATPTPVVEVTPTPSATPVPVPDPGLTDSVIRIGVVVDITTGTIGETGGQEAWDAMVAWARSLNEDGGLAGREVVVVQFDSAVFSHAESLVEACDDVFALVGSWSVNDGDGLETMLSCSLPDFPAAAQTPARRVSPTTYQSNPARNDTAQIGPAQFLAAANTDSIGATALPILDFDSARFEGERLLEGYTAAGFGITQRPTVALDAEPSELVLALQDAEITSLLWSGDAVRLGQYLSEVAATPDLVREPEPTPEGEEPDPDAEPTPTEVQEPIPARPELIFCEPSCYDADWLTETGSVAEGVYTYSTFVPVEETDASFELNLYDFWLGRTRPEESTSIVGAQAWASGRLFEEAVRIATAVPGGGNDPELLTRSSVLDAAETITSWNANGLHGDANPAERIGSPCFVLLVAEEGEWRRNHPFGRGLLDCEDDNFFTLVDTAELGVSITPDGDGAAPAPTVEEPTPEPLEAEPTPEE